MAWQDMKMIPISSDKEREKNQKIKGESFRKCSRMLRGAFQSKREMQMKF